MSSSIQDDDPGGIPTLPHHFDLLAGISDRIDYRTGPLLDMSFHDQDYDTASSSPFPARPEGQRGRFELRDSWADEQENDSSASSTFSSSPRSSPRLSRHQNPSMTESDQVTDAGGSSEGDSSEEYGVFFGKKTEEERMYLRKLQATPPAKAMASPASSPARVVRKRDSREFHRRRTMVFSKKDRLSLSIQAGDRGGAAWDVVTHDGGRRGEVIDAAKSGQQQPVSKTAGPSSPPSPPALARTSLIETLPEATSPVREEEENSSEGLTGCAAGSTITPAIPDLLATQESNAAVKAVEEAGKDELGLQQAEVEGDIVQDAASKAAITVGCHQREWQADEPELEASVAQHAERGGVAEEVDDFACSAKMVNDQPCTTTCLAAEKMDTREEEGKQEEAAEQATASRERGEDPVRKEAKETDPIEVYEETLDDEREVLIAADMPTTADPEQSSAEQDDGVAVETVEPSMVIPEPPPSAMISPSQTVSASFEHTDIERKPGVVEQEDVTEHKEASARNYSQDECEDLSITPADVSGTPEEELHPESTVDGDSPLPTARASNFMSPRYDMRGEHYTPSPTIARLALSEGDDVLSPATQAVQLTVSPLQEEAIRLRRGATPSSPVESTTQPTVGVAPSIEQTLLGISTPRRLAPLGLGTPSRLSCRPALSPVLAASAIRKPVAGPSAPLAPPQARRLQKGDRLPSAATNRLEASTVARRPDISSQLEAAVLRLASAAKSAPSPSPALSRSLLHHKVEVGPSRLRPPMRPSAAPSSSMRPAGSTVLSRFDRPHSRQGLVARDTPVSSIARSPHMESVSKPGATTTKSNVTPPVASQSRLEAIRQSRMMKQSPTPTSFTTSTSGRIALGSRQIPQHADVTSASERPATTQLRKAVRPALPSQARTLPAKVPGSLPVMKPTSYLPRPQATTVMMSRTVLPAAGVDTTVRPATSRLPPGWKAPALVPKTAARVTVAPSAAPAQACRPTTSVHIAASYRTADAAVGTLTDPPCQSTPSALPTSAVERVLPAVPPSSDSRGTSPLTDDSTSVASDLPGPTFAGRTPGLRREKGAMKSKAMQEAALPGDEASQLPGQEQPSPAEEGTTESLTADVEARPTSTVRGRQAGSTTAPAGTSTGRPARLRQRSLAVREPLAPTSLSARASSVPPTLPSQTSRFPIPDKELQAVTKRNTMRNEVYFCAITRTIVRREGPRPPSPTSKIRTVADRKEDEKRISREERARRRDRCRSGDDTEDEEAQSEHSMPAMLFTKHVRGPGDEEDYETPARGNKRARKSQMTAGVSGSPTVGKGVRRKRSRPDVSGKMVRWDKGLILLSDNLSARGGGSADDSQLQPKSCIKEDKKIELDHLGNVPNAQQSLPDLKRSRITVAVICYDGEEPAVPVVPPTAASKGKGSR